MGQKESWRKVNEQVKKEKKVEDVNNIAADHLKNVLTLLWDGDIDERSLVDSLRNIVRILGGDWEPPEETRSGFLRLRSMGGMLKGMTDKTFATFELLCLALMILGAHIPDAYGPIVSGVGFFSLLFGLWVDGLPPFGKTSKGK